VAHGFRRVPVAEVGAFEGEVGADAEFVAGFGAEDGTVVTDADAQGSRGEAEGCGADGLDQGKLAGNGAGWRWAGQEELPWNRIPATFLRGPSCSSYRMAGPPAGKKIYDG